MLFTITSLGNWRKGCVVVVALLKCCQSKVKLLAGFPKKSKARIPLAFKTYAMFAATQRKRENIKLLLLNLKCLDQSVNQCIAMEQNDVFLKI